MCTTTDTTIEASAATRQQQKIKIAVFTLFLNAGETTRAVEIASAVRDMAEQQQRGLPPVEIRFFTTIYSHDDPKISYEHFVKDAGFDITRIGPGYSREQWRTKLEREHDGLEFLQSSDVQEHNSVFQETLTVIKEYGPSLILHGFLDGALCGKILKIPSIAYLPLPLSEEFCLNNMFPDIPEDQQKYGLSLLPQSVRRFLLHKILMLPFLPTFGAQPTLRKVAVMNGWEVEGRGTLIDMNNADLILVNDLPGNYEGVPLVENTHITGPVFPHNDDSKKAPEIETEILRVFNPKNSNKVFISMGSSGHKKHLLEAIKAVSTGEYNVVAVVPPSICSLDELQGELGDLPSSVYLTNKFIPAKHVNRLADIAIIHGGQGTVQTAMGSGTPVVSIAFQPEQRWNLDWVVKRGAGIRLDQNEWNASLITKLVQQILSNKSYKESAIAVQTEMNSSNGNLESAKKILDFTLSKHTAAV